MSPFSIGLPAPSQLHHTGYLTVIYHSSALCVIWIWFLCFWLSLCVCVCLCSLWINEKWQVKHTSVKWESLRRRRKQGVEAEAEETVDSRLSLMRLFFASSAKLLTERFRKKKTRVHDVLFCVCVWKLQRGKLKMNESRAEEQEGEKWCWKSNRKIWNLSELQFIRAFRCVRRQQ